MCTILTFTKEKFRLHEDEILTQLTADAVGNDDGSSLILAGKYRTNITLLKTLDPEVIRNILVNEDSWQRAWVHNRMATTTFKGLMGAHGFHARSKGDDWYLMHNGRFSHKEAASFNVDSEWMMYLLERYGVQSAIKIVADNEYFANIFLVAPTEGKWYMMRTKSGALHTDGQGNYSTNKIVGVMETSVPDGEIVEHKFEIGTKPFVSRTAYTSYEGGKKKESNIVLSTGKGTDITDSIENTRIDTKGASWSRSKTTGLWICKSGEVTLVRRLVNGRE